ncbi:hypothetical protein CANTEDRAFT_92640 [Yamadazyma tenuis ATCC 10573]|uniref:Uncharacterized protein n=1 Tax=Candida tenuis (strain ATCC 10573 / BCRC 21748 / CBS 615 / JCM 9827 / NBRC 10315 / NRRL Y-1498 / VKM Y-70) TaxID=590646 RepID=G3B0K2_CANTC|nr:uncharacterized protein CANTEDRAFT_92640 [Yamadazyma tenuis ATCC 10573]EGV65553.1 hypothetical protein CANTEDRAFT_92640 [Yamadazyma tenuis ATCC 10573]
MDVRIDDSHQVLKDNYQHMTEFHELSSRLYLFEHDLNHNDSTTNSHIYSHLCLEFDYLREKYATTATTSWSSSRDSPNSIHNPKNPPDEELHSGLHSLHHDSTADSIHHGVNSSSDTLDNLMDVTFPQSNDTTPELELHDFDMDKPEDINVNPFDSKGSVFLSTIDCDFNDNESTLSDAPEMDFENFDSFLRRSRVNLSQDSYPYVVRKSVSDASINMTSVDPNIPSVHAMDGNADVSNDSPSKKKVSSFKFHNPIDNIKQSHECLSPTVEAIYSIPSSKSHDGERSNYESLLNKFITPETTPKKDSDSSFSLFNFINSPSATRKHSNSEQPQNQRNSIIGSSLSETFLQLMQTESSVQLVGKKTNTPILVQQKLGDGNSCGSNSRRRKREKLEELKSAPKTKPITIQNETNLKRYPPAFTSNSSSSSLVLNSNKSFIVNHGNMSIFKKPVVSSFSHRSLQEALTSNLI